MEALFTAPSLAGNLAASSTFQCSRDFRRNIPRRKRIAIFHPSKTDSIVAKDNFFSRRSTHPNSFALQASTSFIDENVSQEDLANPSRDSIQETETSELLEHGSGSQFDWNRSWYPVAVIRDLEKIRPYAVTLLGKGYVVWWDKNTNGGCWQVFVDLCPHRLAPLSEGRLHENGNIQCSYHGWTFDGEGSCTGIPQARKDGPDMQKSPRACALRCPSRAQQGMIWMIPDTSADAFQKAAQEPPPSFQELDDPSYVSDIIMRDLPYSFEILTENLMDPSHVPFAHHKIMGDRKNARPLELKVGKVRVDGYEGSWVGEGKYRPFQFIAPGNIKMNMVMSEKKQGDKVVSRKEVALIFLCVPVAPGRSRAIVTFPRNFFTFTHHLIPRWFQHQGQLLVLDSDARLLRLQDMALQDRGGPKRFLSAAFTPAAADAFVIGFYRWLSDFGGGKPAYHPSVDNRLPPLPSQEELLDRYHTHVVHCSDCRRAYKVLSALQVVLRIVAFALLAAVAGHSAIKAAVALPVPALPLMAISFVSFLGSMWLDSYLKNRFHFQDYVHAYVK